MISCGVERVFSTEEVFYIASFSVLQAREGAYSISIAINSDSLVIEHRSMYSINSDL